MEEGFTRLLLEYMQYTVRPADYILLLGMCLNLRNCLHCTDARTDSAGIATDIKRPARSRLSVPVLNQLMFFRLHTGHDLEPSVISAAVAVWKEKRTQRYVNEKELDEVLADIRERVEHERVEKIFS